MATKILVYNCLIISPSDVEEERDAITETIEQWNAHIGKTLSAHVEVVKWESHAVPDSSKPPQEAINSQLLINCDFAIAIFWARVGTKTKEYISGSVEEIYTLLEKGIPVLIYFKTSAIPQKMLQDDQYMELMEVKKRFQSEGLLGEFESISDLKNKVILHVSSIVSNTLSFDRDAENSYKTESKPDIRIILSIGMIKFLDKVKEFIAVTVQNHSNIDVFLGNIFIQSKMGTKLVPLKDFITDEFQTKRKLQPGQNFNFNIDPLSIKEKTKDRKFENWKNVAITDDLDRIYESSEDSFHNILIQLINK